jgi:hypothetical protein
VAGNVGRTGRAHGDSDVTGDDRRQRRDRGAGARVSRRDRRWRRACRPHPSPVPSRCRSGEPHLSRRRRRRRPTTPAPHQRQPTASGVRRQRRTNRPTAPGLRRYRRISTATSHSTCERAIRATLPYSPAAPATPSSRTQPMPLRQTAPQPTATAPPTDHAGAPPARADGAAGTTATSHEPARRSGIATLPSYIDGNVARDVRAGDSCDVAVVAGTTGHAPLPPYPAHAVTAPRREPTATAPPTNHARAPPHNPPRQQPNAPRHDLDRFQIL